MSPCPDERALLLHRLGILEDAETVRVEAHVHDCMRCTDRRAEEELPGFKGSIGHVPPDILARWPAVRSSLSATLGGAVERHFAGCEQCSDYLQRLVRLRESSTSTFVRERTKPSHVRDSEPLQVAVSPSDVAVEPARTPSGRPPRSWTPLLAGYATLATAAALVFALRDPLTASRAPAPGADPEPAPNLRTTPDTIRSGSSGGEPEPTAPTPSPTPPRTSSLAAEWKLRLLPAEPRTLPSVLRGDDGTLPVIERGNDPAMLVVRIDPPVSITPETSLVLELLDGKERVLARTRGHGADFHGGGTVLLGMEGVRLPAGRYSLRLRASEDVVIYPFQIGGGS